MTVHAHKLLNQLRVQPMTKTELHQWAIAEFGEGVEFRTCSREGFDFDAMVQFFLERQKVVLEGEVMRINEVNVCSH